MTTHDHTPTSSGICADDLQSVPEQRTASDLDGATDLGDPAAWPADAGQFAARWNARPADQRDAAVQQMIANAERADACFVRNHEARIRDLSAELRAASRPSAPAVTLHDGGTIHNATVNGHIEVKGANVTLSRVVVPGSGGEPVSAVDDPTHGDGKITVAGVPAEHRHITADPLFSSVDGAPVPGTGAANVVRLQQRNTELLAEVRSLTIALHSANQTTEALRAENDQFVDALARARGLNRDQLLASMRATPAAYCPAGPDARPYSEIGGTSWDGNAS